MLTFPEEITLLLLDDDTGKFVNADMFAVNFALAGAVLMDLALQLRIDTDLEKLTVVDPTPTGDALLDRQLVRIASSAEERDAAYWVADLARLGNDLREEALQQLVAKRVLRRVEKKFLWVFGTRRYPVIDDREEKDAKKRILDVLLSDEIPTPRDVALICLVDTCELLPHILNVHEVEHLAPRIEQVRKLDLLGRAVSEALAQLRLDIAKAMPAPVPF